jgi:hypothetical protein
VIPYIPDTEKCSNVKLYGMGVRQGRESTPAIATEIILLSGVMQIRTSIIVIRHSKYVLQGEERNVHNT